VKLSAETESQLRELAKTVTQRARFRTRDEGGWFWDEITTCFRITAVKNGKIPALSRKDGPLLPIADANGNCIALATRGPKRGEVYCVNHEYEPGEKHRTVRIAKSLRELIKKLKAETDEPQQQEGTTDKQWSIVLQAFGVKPTKANLRKVRGA
jgi:hypothetical protein